MTTTTILSAMSMRLKKTGSPGQSRLDVLTDSSGGLGATLESANVDASSVGTSVGNVVVNFASTTVLTAGTSYWFRLTPLGTCDVSNMIEWRGTGGVGGTGGRIGCGATLTGSAFPALGFALYTTTYTTSGTFLSRALDVGITTDTWLFGWSTFTASYIVSPALTGISFQTQTSSSATGSFTGLVGVSSGSFPTSTVQRFIRYQAAFTTNNPSTSPILNDATLNISGRVRPAGTYYSAVLNAPRITTWDSFQVTKADFFGSNTYYIRTSSNPFQVTSSTPSWTALIGGSIPTVSTGTYIQIRDDIVTTANPPTSPILYDFTLNWFEGIAADKMYCTYFNDGLWFAIAYGNSASTNNRVLLYDLLNQTWLVHDIPSNGFLVRQNRLFFSSALEGKVFKFGETDSDNGTAINAYWKSKDFFGDTPFSTNEFTNISVIAKSVSSSSMTVTYDVNGSSETSYAMSLSNLNSSFVSKNKNLPAGVVGNTLSIKFGNNSAEQPFEVFGVQFGTRPKSWVPSQ